jgi:hypothetical protein
MVDQAESNIDSFGSGGSDCVLEGASGRFSQAVQRAVREPEDRQPQVTEIKSRGAIFPSNSTSGSMPQTAGSGFWRSLSVRLVGLMLLAGIPTAALVVHNALEVRDAAVNEAMIRTQALAKKAAADLENRIAGAKYLLSALAQMPSVQLARQPDCSQLLSDFVQRAPPDNPLSLTVAASDGAAVCSGTPLTGPVNLASRDYFIESFATHCPSVGRPVLSRF